MFDVLFNGFDHNDRVVHHQTNCQDKAEQRESIDGEAKQWKNKESADQRHGYGQQGNQRGAPTLKEEVHNDNDEDEGLDEGMDDLSYALSDGERCVQSNRIVEAGRELSLGSHHEIFGALSGLNGVGPRKLVNSHDRGWLAIQPALQIVNLSPKFNSSHVLQAYERAVRVGADDDLTELLHRNQAALRNDREGTLLPRRHRFSTDLSSGIHGVLHFNGVDNLRNCDL